MIAWAGYGGECDPVKFGVSLLRAREEKAKSTVSHPCPAAWYERDDQIEKVATRYCGGIWLSAREMLHKTPALFYRLLGNCEIKAEAEPIAMEYMDEKRKRGVGGPGGKRTLGS